MLFGKKESKSAPVDQNQTLKQIGECYQKLRSLHADSSVTWNSFFDRYRRAEKNRLDISLFLQEELKYIERFIQTLKKKLSGKKSKIYEDIASQYYQAYKKYPQVEINPNTPAEFEHLLGAMFEFNKRFSSPLRELDKKLKKKSLSRSHDDFSYILEGLAVPLTDHLPRSFVRFQRETAFLEKQDDIERLGQRILKEVFTVTMKILEYVNRIYHEVESIETWQIHWNDQKISFIDFRAQIREAIDGILADFRLTGLI